MWEPEVTPESTEEAPVDVLVVDDDSCSRLWGETLLRSGGWRVQSVTTGEEALSWLQTHPRPRAVLLDLRLPGIDGNRVAWEIRSTPALADLPIILYTIVADLDREIASHYATRCLKKPAAPAVLIQTFREICSA
jgi:CheY-like chemotaxis protein